MLPGESDPEDIIKSVTRGVYAKRFSGGQVNISNGDFVFALTESYLIEDGKLTAPLKGVNLIGNGPDVLRKVTMLGHDFALSEGTWTCGKDGQSVPVGIGTPTMKIAEITGTGETNVVFQAYRRVIETGLPLDLEHQSMAFGRWFRIVASRLGLDGLETALGWIEKNDGAAGGRVRGILVPREVETSSVALLRRTRDAADANRLPMATHAAYSVLEFHDVVREHMMTPIELLDDLGMLRPTMNIGHGNFIADNPNLNYARSRDLALMGKSGSTISHCPINIVRRARVLDHWAKYQDAGVNISIGSDTYPRDMIMNMRAASYMGKVMGHSYFAATGGEVFEAATLGGAKSVGRDDLGRLAPGALADIIIIDLSGGNTLRYGPVRDPVRSVVDCGVGDDVDTVIVDGKVCMQGGVIPGVDFRRIRADTQAASEAIWATLPDWDPLGRTADEACPHCYPDG